MGEAKRRKRAGSTEPRARQLRKFDPKELAGRSLGSVFEQYGPKPGGGWKWDHVEGRGGEMVFFFTHPDYPGVQRVIGGTVALHYYRPTSDADPFDEGADRYYTLAEAIQATLR